MNRFKATVIILKSSFWLLTLGLILLISLPFMAYQNKQQQNIYFANYSDQNTNGLNWALEHEKLVVKGSKIPDVMFLNSANAFNDELLLEVDGNIILSEMIFSEFGGNIERREYLENLIGNEFTGFIGKTYNDLSDRDEVPAKVIELYETMHDKWTYYGEGIVMSNEETIIVLEKGLDYKGQLDVVTQDVTAPYTGYFEVLKNNNDSEVNYNIKTTDSGESQLSEHGLFSTFPALVSVSTRLYDWHYLAGAFSEIDVNVPSEYDLMPEIMKNKILYDTGFDEELYWKWYYSYLSKSLKDRKVNVDYSEQDSVDNNKFIVEDKTIKHKISDTEAKVFFMKGINLGAALPGKTFTEFPMDKSVYTQWLNDMGTLNINTLRIYTLLPPVFYEALFDYNTTADKPIYLLQEIWPEENPYMHNYLGEAYNKTYRQEIEYVVHAIHGNMNIPKRSYRAYGMYTYDVSEYLIGYLVGREMEPDEVQVTDNLNKKYSYKGRYLYSEPGASPTEAWLASACDYALQIEDNFYSDKPLTAIVSWPTLDLAEHDSEWNLSGNKTTLYNDSTVVDINNIGTRKENTTGFFGAYHIYPNYPDFINNESDYNNYHDDQGRFRYGGYLQEFMNYHNRYPAVVAEYGISTSSETAHVSPDGYNHGGLSELDQANGIIRMTEAIVREGYNGAIIFEWMDEWAKKTWTTEPYMIPYNRHPLWHNILDPEQNYGLLAVEVNDPEYTLISKDLKHDQVKSISAGQNESFIYFKFELTDSNMLSSEMFNVIIVP